MRRFCSWALLLIGLAACQIQPPVERIPTPTIAITPSATSAAQVRLPFVAGPQATPTGTAEPTLTPTSTPTITSTPQPTNTPLPTITPTIDPATAPVVLIARPLADEFVTAEITVSGKVANVASGVVTLRGRTPDGQPVGRDPVVASTQVVTDGLGYDGVLTLELPPTPRQMAVVALWSQNADAEPVAEASQVVSILGRYGRVDRIVVETPRPFERGTADRLAVRGVAPGPPAKMLARLLDDNDQVIETVEARLDWYQPGLPCEFRAELPNNPAGTQLQVISLGPDDAVLEAVKVRLTER
ncbi:MAG TPA: hypothetical protein VGD58_27570 [Herpetosiphonaceae bacterium]